MNSAPTAAATASAARVVLQHVHAERRPGEGAADLRSDHAHGRYGGGLDAAGREGRVAEVLDEERVDTALDQRAGVGQRRRDDPRHRAVPPRTAG